MQIADLNLRPEELAWIGLGRHDIRGPRKNPEPDVPSPPVRELTDQARPVISTGLAADISKAVDGAAPASDTAPGPRDGQDGKRRHAPWCPSGDEPATMPTPGRQTAKHSRAQNDDNEGVSIDDSNR